MPPPNPKTDFSDRQLAIIRLSLLRYISKGEECLNSGYLVSFIRAEGFRGFDKAVCDRELQYLLSRELISEIPNAIAPESKHWRITSKGIDLLVTQTGEA